MSDSDSEHDAEESLDSIPECKNHPLRDGCIITRTEKDTFVIQRFDKTAGCWKMHDVAYCAHDLITVLQTSFFFTEQPEDKDEEQTETVDDGSSSSVH